jgi:hypothetical protein
MADIEGGPISKNCQLADSIRTALVSFKKRPDQWEFQQFWDTRNADDRVNLSGVYDDHNALTEQYRLLLPFGHRLKTASADTGSADYSIVLRAAKEWISNCTDKLLDAGWDADGIRFDLSGSSVVSFKSNDRFFKPSKDSSGLNYKTCPTRFQISKIMALIGK